MSARVMRALSRFTPDLEIYSIDEAFLGLAGFETRLPEHMRELRRTVLRWTGIPVSVGIAPTKLAASDRERYVTAAALEKRPGKLFIDYLRNGRGTTAIGAYSPRARPGFPVAAPVTWREVENGLRSEASNLDHPPKKG
jgi:impB/mucB/samB family